MILDSVCIWNDKYITIEREYRFARAVAAAAAAAAVWYFNLRVAEVTIFYYANIFFFVLNNRVEWLKLNDIDVQPQNCVVIKQTVLCVNN